MALMDTKNNSSRGNSFASSEGFSVFLRRVSATIVILVALVILTGWTLEIPRLIAFRGTWPPVAPLTALDFAIVGVITWLLPSPGKASRAGRDGLLLALGVVVILTSALIIARYLLGAVPPVDMLVFAMTAKRLGWEYDVVMPPATALAFLCTGFWFIADFAKPRFEILKSLLSLFVLALSLTIFGAYLYGASGLYEMPFFLKMSGVTAGLFTLTHLGLLAVEPPFGFKLQSPRRFWRDKNTLRERPLYVSLVVVFSVFLVAGVATSQSLNRLIDTIQNVADTQRHIQELDELFMGLLNAESGQRGFLLTGDDAYLEPYFAGREQYEEGYKGLLTWIHNHPQYNDAFGDIEKTARVKLSELGETIVWRRANSLAAANKVVQSDVGRHAMETIRHQVGIIKDDQLRLLTLQREENQVQVRRTITSITLGSLLATVLLLTCLNLYIKNSLKRSEVEDEVRHLNSTLEVKLHEIEVVNRELESFSYSVSHDLRAPLRAMAGFSNILLEDYEQKLDDDGRKYLGRIIVASDKMSRLIDGILDLSRISRRQVKRETVNISELAQQIIGELRVSEPARKVEVLIEPDLTVLGDMNLVGVVLQNLLGNAWKFTAKKESPHITVGSIMKENRKVFFVRDDGAGFDMAYSEKLFGTFQRLHSESEFAGTGVGLATVRRIAHLHGGEVWAEGTVNQGATFYFTLD